MVSRGSFPTLPKYLISIHSSKTTATQAGRQVGSQAGSQSVRGKRLVGRYGFIR